MNMEKERETIQIRVNKDLKDQLAAQAVEMGVSTSELIRRLIKMAVRDDHEKIAQLDEKENDLRLIVIELMKCLQKMFMQKSWEAAKKVYWDSIVGRLLDDELFIHYSKMDRSDLYDKEIKELLPY